MVDGMMKKLLFLLLTLSLVFAACKKDKDAEEYNTVKITSGVNSGVSYTFEPNTGYVAYVDQTTRSYQLVFGSGQPSPPVAPGILDMFFYYKGINTITFPSADGQYIWFKLTINDQDCMFQDKNVDLSILEVTDNFMTGRISGEFHDSCNGSESVQVEMDFNITIVPH